jgi:hypothetical protein
LNEGESGIKSEMADSKLTLPIPSLRKEAGPGTESYEVDRRKGDYKSEVHFIGEISYGSLFPENEELFCEAALELSKDWELLSQHTNKFSIQTHCCICAV